MPAPRRRAASPAGRRASLGPDQRRHPSARRVTPMREEAVRFAERAVVAAVDRGHAGAAEALCRERVEIGLPAAAGVPLERTIDREPLLGESRPDLVAYLERARPDRRSEPCEDVVR